MIRADLNRQSARLLHCLCAAFGLGFSACLNMSVNAQNDAVQNVVHASEDARMYDQMSKVSGWINYYTTVNHRFPESGDEMKAAKEELNQLIPNPPYNPHAMRLSPGLDADPLFAQPEHPSIMGVEDSDTGSTLDRVHLIIDLSLTELEIQGWRTDPPVDWQVPPGTVTVISNQQSLFVVWGAGADGLPLRDQYSNRVLMIIGRYHGLYDTQD